MQRRPIRMSINEQLQIGVPKNPNIPSRYARGLFSMQPQLGVEDWSLDFYNDTAALGNMSNANGDFSNAGGYGIFCGKKCIAKRKAAGIPPKRGAKNIAAFEAEQAAKAEAEAAEQAAILAEQSSGGGSGSGSGAKGGMSTGVKIGIGVGSLVLVSLISYLIFRKR